MILRYGVSRSVRIKGRKKIESKNGRLRIRKDAKYSTIIGRLVRMHPGWTVMGYCPEESSARK